MTCSVVIFSLCSRWIAEVARKTWILGLLGVLESLPGPVDVAIVAAGEAADRRAGNLGGDCADSLEVARRGDREPCLDHVDTEQCECPGDLDLFEVSHARPGRLLAIAQGGVEDQDPVRVRSGVGHDGCSSVSRVGWAIVRKREKPRDPPVGESRGFDGRSLVERPDGEP